MVEWVVGMCEIARRVGDQLQLRERFAIRVAIENANVRSESCLGWCRLVGG